MRVFLAVTYLAFLALGLGSLIGACATESGPASPTAGSGVTTSGASSESGSSSATSGTMNTSTGSNVQSGSGSPPNTGPTGSGSGSTVVPVQDGGATDDATVQPTGSNVPSDKFIPKAKGTCPTLATGMGTFAGQQVQLFVGKPTAEQHGPLLLYWHATGSSAPEVVSFFGQAQIDAITALGGMVASFASTTASGMTTGNNVWYVDDFNTADEVVACAIAGLHIDTRQIFTSGGSAGALQAVWMAYARSGYIAADGPISGGIDGLNGTSLTPITMPQDPTSVPSGFVAHGAPGSDVVIIDFAVQSAAYEADVKKKGGYTVDCNNGGGHVGTAGTVGPAMWEYFKSHPFKTNLGPDPYAGGLPADFPKFCQLGPRAADGGAP